MLCPHVRPVALKRIFLDTAIHKKAFSREVPSGWSDVVAGAFAFPDSLPIELRIRAAHHSARVYGSGGLLGVSQLGVGRAFNNTA